ncbi:MAG: hypothetical protein JST81_01205 [Bacteroidetes bacterium]|nr:hypothetical protein [Bacteroidota bacterium]
MNKKILLIEAVLALVIVLGFREARLHNNNQTFTSATPSREKLYANRFMIGCSPDWNLLNADSLGRTMVPLPGWGNYTWPIESNNDSARFYFNQGINMYYAFHIIESLASFKKASQFDSANAMLYWAQALAYGPNINDVSYAAAPDALAATQKAVYYSSKNTPKEKALIEAMRVRYTSDTTVSRTDLNEKYAAAMLQVLKQFPNDADVHALYADARMLQHPWEYWEHNGNPKAWTPEILSVLEKALTLSPMHPGLNHYYIHMCEASLHPEKATASAERLEHLMPDVSHMVHMPSHIYIRTGKYAKGIAVNNSSINGYRSYLSLYPDVAGNDGLYLVHNLHLKTACAMLMPDYTKALEAASECATSFDTSYLSLPQPIGNFIQYVYAAPLMVQVQYEKWDEILSTKDHPEQFAFVHAFSKWSKGMAYAAKGNMNEATKELEALRKIMKHPDMQVLNYPFNKAVDQMTVGEKILCGMIAEKENKLKEAIGFLTQAVTLEDALVYQEPRDWLNDARIYLAKAYISNGDYVNAEKVIRKSLEISPRNYPALLVLKKLYATQKGKADLLQKTEREIKEYYPQ